MDITIWQVEDGSINKTAQVHDLIGARVRISSDLKWLVVVTSPSTSNFGNPGRHNLQVRDFSSNKVFFSKELTGGWMVQELEISPNHQWLAVSYEGVLELYDLNLIKPEVGPVEPTLALDYPEKVNFFCPITFSSDSTLIALGVTWAFDTQTGRWYHRYPPFGMIGWNVKFVPGTYTLAFTTDDHNVCLWQVYEGMCERWGLPLQIFDVGFAHSDTWIAILGEGYLYLYDFEKRTLITSVSIPLIPISDPMVVSRDDQTVVLNNWGEVLVLHMGALLTQIPPPTPTSIIHYCMSDDGGLSSHNIGGKLEVLDTATGTRISELPLLPFGGTVVLLATFSPSGHDLAFTYNRPHDLHILVWNLSDNRLRYYESPHSIDKSLAVSDDGGKEGYWLAAASEYCVSVWGITTGKHKKLIDLTNDVSKKVSQIAFTGSRLGVLFQDFRDSQSCGWEFSLLDTGTSEQLYRVMSSRPDDYSYGETVLRLSPNGTSGMFYEIFEERLSVWDLEGNIGCVGISTPNSSYFFRDEETLYTQQGHFSIHSAPAETTQSVVYGRDVRPGQNQKVFLPSSTVLELKGYAYTNSRVESWIHLDNMPLLWVPAQYHPDAWTNVACGEDYVVIQAKAGVYSIRFKENARDFI